MLYNRQYLIDFCRDLYKIKTKGLARRQIPACQHVAANVNQKMLSYNFATPSQTRHWESLPTSKSTMKKKL